MLERERSILNNMIADNSPQTAIQKQSEVVDKLINKFYKGVKERCYELPILQRNRRQHYLLQSWAINWEN